MPSKLLVIGSGAIGIEFASFYNDMGAEVTRVELLDRIVPVEDADVSDFMAKARAKQAMTIRPSTGMQKLELRGEDVAPKSKVPTARRPRLAKPKLREDDFRRGHWGFAGRAHGGRRSDRADLGAYRGKQLETTKTELMETVFRHPILSEMMHESVLSADDRVLHM